MKSTAEKSVPVSSNPAKKNSLSRKSQGMLVPERNSHHSSFFSKDRSSFFSQSDSFIQPKLSIGKPGDKYEQEADAMAEKVVSGPSIDFATPALQTKCDSCENELQKMEQDGEVEMLQAKLDTSLFQHISPVSAAGLSAVSPVQKQAEPDSSEEELQRKEESPEGDLSGPDLIQTFSEEDGQIQTSSVGKSSGDTTSLSSRLAASKGQGSSLPAPVQSSMGNAFGADFSNVRIHTGNEAIGMSGNLNAHAFTHGSDIYFNEGKYNPNSTSGQKLLAHELTHTVQQGAALRMKPELELATEMVQASFLPSVIRDYISDEARHIPGYTLMTVIAGYDPLMDQQVLRTPINLIEGVMGLVPFGTVIFDKLQEYGIIQQVFDWINSRLSELNLSVNTLTDLLQQAWDENSLGGVLGGVRDKLGLLFERVRSFAASLVDQVIQWIKDALIGIAEPLLAENKAYALIKKIIKYDPLRGVEVSATTVEILEDFLKLIGKETELAQMRERGTLQETADWLDTQVGTFMSLLGELRGLVTAVWDAIQPENLVNISASLTQLAAQAGSFLERVWSFASSVAIKVLELVKHSLLSWLSDYAKTVRGYQLVTVIIGKDPFTNEVVPRSIRNIIRGFMSLMEGGEAQFAQMEESGALARITDQIEAAVAALNMTPEFIVQLFTDIWNSFTIDDLINPLAAFVRILDSFGEPIGRLIVFVAEIVRIVIVGILELMNFPFDLIQNIITRAMGAIENIKRDPIGFLKNILRALKQGFIQFFDNIVTHLISGVTGWLMSELADSGVPVLTDFTLRGVITWVLDVLGITMEKIWEKLAAHPRIGPQRVARIRSMINTLEGIWTFIKDVQERGMAAIWDKIQEQLSNLWDTVLSAVKNFIMEQIVNRVTARLLSMLDPTGIMAVINGAMALFNAIQSFIRYLREMLEVVNSFVNGVADLAEGNVGPAANYLERTMGQAMPVVIGFLANQVGLGGIGRRIGEIIADVRVMVDESLTALINRAVDTGMNLLDRVMGGGGLEQDNRTIEQKQADVDLATSEAQTLIDSPTSNLTIIQNEFPIIKTKYKLNKIDLILLYDRFHVDIEINPRKSTRDKELGPFLIKKNDIITFKRGEGRSFGEVIEVRVENGDFDFMTIGFKSNAKVTTRLSDETKSWWRSSSEALELPKNVLESENANETWSSINMARSILNWRRSGQQRNRDASKQWEHIIENRTRIEGIHSSNNLAWTDADFNQWLNTEMGRPRQKELVINGILRLVSWREYLDAINTESAHREFKISLYSNRGYSLKSHNVNDENPRGIWQELSQ